MADAGPPVTGIGSRLLLLPRRHPAAVATFAAYTLGFVAFARSRSDGRLWAFLVVVAVVYAAVAATDRAASLSPGVVWALVGLGFAHLCGGLLPSPTGAVTLYETWLVPGLLKYDQAVHLAGSAIATFVAWQLVGRYLDLERTTVLVQAQLAALVGLGKGAVNEVFEFLAAASIPGMAIGDGANTGWDLAFNLAGVVAAAVWLATAGVARRTPAAESELARHTPVVEPRLGGPTPVSEPATEPAGRALSPWRRPRWRPRPG